MVDPGIHIAQAAEPGHTTVRVEGALDIRTLPALRGVLDALSLQPAEELRIDLTEVSFLGAATVGLIADTASRLEQQGNRVLVQASPKNARLFRLLDLGHLLTPEDA